jgi:hypothetical protein
MDPFENVNVMLKMKRLYTFITAKYYGDGEENKIYASENYGKYIYQLNYVGNVLARL